MADHEHTRQRFEDHCWQHYMAERERRDLPGDVPDAFPTREQLFWRMPDGRYGVLMFNAAWLAWCWAMGEKHQSRPVYSSEMGEAGERYIQSVAFGNHRLPALFRWSDLLDVMLSAAPTQHVTVPDPLEPDDWYETREQKQLDEKYIEGWNACREQMLASSAQVQIGAGK